MRDPLPRSLFSKKSTEAFTADVLSDSWLNRVRENLAQLLLPSPFKPSSANGAPIHLLQFDKSPRPARAQGASLLTHIAVFAAIVFLLTRVTAPPPPPLVGPTNSIPITYNFPIIHTIAGPHPSNGSSNGGDHNPLPPAAGAPPPRSPIQLVRPTLPPSQNPTLPEPPTILDPTAAPVLNTAKIGLQWMPTDNNSAGPGANHGIGTGPDGGAGTGGLGQYGSGGDNSLYGPGFVPPTCAYCPYPTYTDDARHAKVQGTVTVQVLVGPDGRARDFRILKGIGFGLDERTIDSIRGWKFTPARDTAKRPIPSWVTIEAVFRLF
jgi:periplasmic protein TonB